MSKEKTWWDGELEYLIEIGVAEKTSAPSAQAAVENREATKLVGSDAVVSCPFCGAPGTLVEEHSELPNNRKDTLFHVECSARRCGARTLSWYPVSAALNAWNTRAANIKGSRGSAAPTNHHE